MDAGAAEVAVDQKGTFVLAGVGDGEVRGDGGFAFAGAGAGQQHAAQAAVEIGEQDRIAKRADGFLIIGEGLVGFDALRRE